MRRAFRFGVVVVAVATTGCSGSSGNAAEAGDSGGTGDDGSAAGVPEGGTGTPGIDGGVIDDGAGSAETGVATVPAAFTLVSPVKGSSAQPLTPTLQWNASDNADSYVVEIATSTTFGAADVVHRSVIAPTTQLAVAASTLTAGVIYHWRVTAVNAAGSTVATDAPGRFSSPYQVPGAHGIAVTPDGTRLVVASNVNSGPIDIIDLATHAITATIRTGVASQPMGIAVSPDGTQALATLLTNGAGGVNGIAAIDLTSGTLTANISDPCVGTTLSDVAYFPSGAQAAVPDLSAGCAAMGLNTFAPSAASPGFTFVNFNDTNNPNGVAISPNGAFALVTMQLDRKVYKVTFPGTVTAISIPSTSAGVAITPDGTKAVVAGSSVDVITLSDDSVATIALMNDTPGGDFHNVAITPDGTEAVVVGSASVQVISLSNGTVLGSYPDGAGAQGSVALSPDGKTAFVTDRANGWVRVLQIP